jgi:hypothetical protein
MKIAEALINRADMNKRIAQLRERLVRYARVQEGDAPAEDPQAMLAEFRRVNAEMTAFVQHINRTNAATAYTPGVTLTDALAERDALKVEHATLIAIVTQAASLATNDWRYGRSEIKYTATVDVPALQAQADDVARHLRELDIAIQAMNWQIDVVE